MTNVTKISAKEMEGKLREQLSILMTGSREEFKAAKKEIEKLWHHETKPFKSHAHIVFEFLPKFDQIEKTINKEAFVSGLSFFFLTLSDGHFDVLKNFTLQVIQHPNGHVREAIRKTADWLFCSLTERAYPFVYPEGKELTDKQKAEQTMARKQYTNYVKEIEALIDKHDNGDEDAEYIDDMKPSINKSLQQLWGRLTECRVYQKILEETTPIPLEIFMRRKDIEKEIENMIKKTNCDFELDDIKDMIYNEDGADNLTNIIAMFDTGQGAVELHSVLELANDAWNYFPHKILNGLSPADKLLEYRNKTK